MNKLHKQTKLFTRFLESTGFNRITWIFVKIIIFYKNFYFFLKAIISNGSRSIASFNHFERIGQNVNPLLPSSNPCSLKQQIRFKKSHVSKGKSAKTSSGQEEDSGDEYSDNEDDNRDDKENLAYINSIDTSQYHPGFKIIQKAVPSLRFDSVISVGLNLSRK